MESHGDHMRTHLVTKFICSECGELLTLSYAKPKYAKYAEGEPTGAAMVENVITIHPCRKCTESVNKLKTAIKTLMESGGL